MLISWTWSCLNFWISPQMTFQRSKLCLNTADFSHSQVDATAPPLEKVKPQCKLPDDIHTSLLEESHCPLPQSFIGRHGWRRQYRLLFINHTCLLQSSLPRGGHLRTLIREETWGSWNLALGTSGGAGIWFSLLLFSSPHCLIRSYKTHTETNGHTGAGPRLVNSSRHSGVKRQAAGEGTLEGTIAPDALVFLSSHITVGKGDELDPGILSYGCKMREVLRRAASKSDMALREGGASQSDWIVNSWATHSRSEIPRLLAGSI